MAGGVDITKRKPRRTRGTPSYYYRNRFACGVIVVGSLIFAAFYSLPFVDTLNEKVKRDFMTRSEEEIERSAFFSFLPQKRGKEILEIMQHKEDLEKER